MSTIFDVTVMGGGSGGYAATLRAAQNGFSVVRTDDGVNAQGEPSPGGTCLNIGCIPSKSLLQSSELCAQVQHEASIHGVNVDGVSFNTVAMIQRKDAIVSRLTMGTGLLLKKNKVKYLCGLVTLEHARDEIWQLRVNDQQIRARNVVIATGSQPRQLPSVIIDNQQTFDNHGALALTAVPPHLGVIGAGMIGLELGSVWNRVDSDVTLPEMAPTFLPALEVRLLNGIHKAMIASGMEIQLAVGIEVIEQRDNGVHVRWWQGEKREESRFDKLILAIGRISRLSGVDLVQLGLEADNRGGIAVDNLCHTGKAGLWAVDDVVRGPMLAHKAMAEGVVVVDQITGLTVEPINFTLTSSVIYTQPGVARIGESEASLKAAGRVFNKGNSLFAGNSRALVLGQEGGRCTLYSDKHTDRIFGGAIVDPQASELINEIALAMTSGASGEGIACAIHAHPTLSEVIHEAAITLNDKTLHG